jgi:hypothetical protein
MKRILIFGSLIVILLITGLIAFTSITPNNQTDIPSNLFLTDFLVLSESLPAALVVEQEDRLGSRKRRRLPRHDLQTLLPQMSRASPISLEESIP